MSKIIIHVDDDLDVESAIEYVTAVVNQGKISANGESYSYGTTFHGMEDVYVTTNKPNGNGTIRFNVMKQEIES